MNKLFCCILLFIFFIQNLFSVQKGSETAVTVEPRAFFPAIDSDNKMAAFGWFKNGFILQDSNTSCTFDSSFPVSGEITLNGGSLYLETDLHLANVTTLTALGTIYGNNHVLELDSSIKRILDSNTKTVFRNTDLFLHSDLQISTTIFFEGDCYINGRDRIFELDPNIEIIVGKNSTLTLKNIGILGLSRNKIKCFDQTGKIIFDNATCQLDGAYNFTVGSLEILNLTELCGTYTFFFDSNQTITINKKSQITITDNLTFALGKNNPSIKQNHVWFQDSTSKVTLDNGNLIVGKMGSLITKGTLEFKGKVNIDVDSTTTTNGLIFGDGTEANDINVVFYPASKINFYNSPLVYNLTRPNRFISMSSYSKLIRGPTSIFYVKKNITYSDLTIKVDPTSIVLVDPGTEVDYGDCKFTFPSVIFSITGSRFNTYTSTLDGNDEIFLQEGTLPLYTLVKNTGNKIHGNGLISGAITLYNSDAEVTFDLDGQIQNNLYSYGGKIILSRDLEFAHEKIILGLATVNLASNDLIFGSKDLNWTSTIYWDGNDGKLELNSDVNLSSLWTFSGNCTIIGNDNIINLQSTGNIFVERGSTLTLKNVRLNQLQNTNFQCLDDTGKIIIDGCCCKLINDFNFEKGTLDFDNTFEVHGNKTFAYKSNQICTIKKCAVLTFKPGSTFSYEPNALSKDLIQFECDASTLAFDKSSLHSTTTGLQITKGSLEITGKCFVISDATCKAEGIILGDGISSLNDLKVQINPQSSLELTSGYLVCKNLS